MKIKKSVELSGLKIEMRPVLVIVDYIYSQMGFEVEITSTTEALHGSGSLHPFGFAVDVGVKGMNDAQVDKAINHAQVMLGPDYQVLKESNHVHIEYQPRFIMSSTALIAMTIKLIQPFNERAK